LDVWHRLRGDLGVRCTRVLSALGQRARPPHACARVEHERRHEHRAHDEGVEQDAEAIVKPSSVSVLSGSVASIVKVPARTIPADVMTPPVTARPRSIPSRAPWRSVSSRVRAIRKML
jgi:hypothetical protein